MSRGCSTNGAQDADPADKEAANIGLRHAIMRKWPAEHRASIARLRTRGKPVHIGLMFIAYNLPCSQSGVLFGAPGESSSIVHTGAIDSTLPAEPDPAGGVGACCLGNACQALHANECAGQGGCFEGAGSSCTPTLCQRACCIFGQPCQNTNRCHCQTMGGFSPGASVTCNQAPCARACCIPSLPGCFDILPETCAVVNGITGEDGSTCFTSTCELPCCCTSGELTCTVRDISECTSPGCSLITSTSCTEPDCNANGMADPCEIRAGLLVDVNGNLVPDVCEMGACCNDTADEPPFCTSPTSLADCPAGRFRVNVSCEQEPFTPPCGIRACCTADASCADLTRSDCLALDGLWLLTSTCEQGPQFCPPVACLTADQPCNQPSPEAAGCSNVTCCTEVCEADPFCCDALWDETCVLIAEKSCWRPCCIASEFQCANFPTDFCTSHGGLSLTLADSCSRPDCNANGINDICDVFLGTSTDCNGNSVPDECECQGVTLRMTDPPNGVVDARQPHAINDASQVQGISMITIAGAPCAERAQWTLCEAPQSSAPNSIDDAASLGECTILLTLARPLTPGSATRFFYLAESGPQLVGTLIAHPANVNGDSTASAGDILRIIDCLNGVAPDINCGWGLYSRDIDHSGQFNPTDILRVIDLLNGAGAFEPWNGTARPAGTCTP